MTLREAISGNQWSLCGTRGERPQFSEYAISGNQWQSVTIK